MELRVKIITNGTISKAVERVAAAEGELYAAAAELERVCCQAHVSIEEAASATNADG